ncbi:hypothetical protein KQJ29_25235, partial [Enterococcus sp. S181_ASV_20]|nr:hypothetical protein [Enterococcus sp. S181_ASV_20]
QRQMCIRDSVIPNQFFTQEFLTVFKSKLSKTLVLLFRGINTDNNLIDNKFRFFKIRNAHHYFILKIMILGKGR